MRIIDISRPIHNGTPVFPGDPPIAMTRASDIGPGSKYRVTRLGGWTTHVGTHLDAPAHFVADGQTLDAMPMERFVLDALLVAADASAVTPVHLPVADIAGRAVLFHTAARTDQPAGHGYVTEEAARVLAERGAGLVGIDSPSLDPLENAEFPAHLALLRAGVLILEGLDLSQAAPGWYTLFALPLRIQAADGSPVRAALLPRIGP